MYRAVLFPKTQRDLHHFVWREDPEQRLVDYRMTRLTFGMSASSFATKKVMKQNALENVHTQPHAVQAVLDSFYVDDGLTGANSIEEAVQLCKELHELFALGGFVLHKWKSSESAVVVHIPSHLLDKKTLQEITCNYAFTKVLGVEWGADSDTFCPMISLSSEGALTKQTLFSLIARLHDILCWCSPALIKPMIMLQRLWEDGLDWDNPVSRAMRGSYECPNRGACRKFVEHVLFECASYDSQRPFFIFEEGPSLGCF